MLIWALYYHLFVVIRIAFEERPWEYVIYLEFFVSFVYFLDFIRCFTEPFMKDGRYIYNRR